jgi:3-methyladenine DNA glycosylase/8-oxoguanine DNA glycosylase
LRSMPRALSAVDELATQEPRLLEAIRAAHHLPAAPRVEELERLSEKWRPYRMWVAVSFGRAMAGGAGMSHSRAAD